MSNTPSLLPCPFCSGANVKIHVYKGEAPDAFVQCHDCSSSGPSGESTTGAIEAWNRRTPQPVVREPLTTLTIAPVRRFLADRGIYLSDETTKELIVVAHGITQKGGSNAE